MPPRHRQRRSPRSPAANIAPSDLRAALATLGDCTWGELLRHLRPPRGNGSRLLRRLLDALVTSGEVVRSHRGAYRLASAEQVVGVMSRQAGALRLRADDGRVLPLGDVGGARAGDRVTAIVDGDRVSSVRVLEPSADPVIGVLTGSPRRPFVATIGGDLKGRIELTKSTTARLGDVVEVRLTASVDGAPRGEIVRVVEAANEPARAAEALLKAHRVPRNWSFDVDSAIADAEVVAERGVAGRVDLRTLPLVTIDGADARDHDDAVFAEPRRRGGWRLVVAIADVAHFVPPGSALDRDARERGNSIYLPDRVVPMLPEALSNDRCSLVPERDRLAMVCDMRVAASGRLTGYEFVAAVVCSRARLTYDEVEGFLHGGALAAAPAVADSLTALQALTRAFRARRAERGALDLETSETRVELSGGEPVGVTAVARKDAHLLIEEAMIAANVAAARHLERRGKLGAGVAPVYRVHEPPVADKQEALAAALRLAGERLPRGKIEPRTFVEVCRRARAKSSWPGWIWDAIVLRALSQARYETRRLGHFGLALPSYAHFTSPIRRYADLLIHRMIKGEAMVADDVDAAAAHISMTERRAEEVERGVDAWLKCALAEERVGETCSGVVAAVVPFGLFVEIDGLGAQGLLHVSKLGRDYYDYAEETMSLVANGSGRRFTLGDRLEVVIEDVSMAQGRIDLALASGDGSRGRGRGRGSRRRRARSIERPASAPGTDAPGANEVAD